MNQDAKLGALALSPSLLCVLLFSLKLIGWIDWPWWIIVAPIWVPIFLAFYWFFTGLAAAALIGIKGIQDDR